MVFEVEFSAEAEAETCALAFLIDVVLRGELVAADVEGSAGVDGIKVRESAGVVVACGEVIELVADADVGEGIDAFGPCEGIGAFGEPAFGFGFGFELVANLVADAVADGFGDVGDAEFVGLGDGRRCGRRWGETAAGSAGASAAGAGVGVVAAGVATWAWELRAAVRRRAAWGRVWAKREDGMGRGGSGTASGETEDDGSGHVCGRRFREGEAG